MRWSYTRAKSSIGQTSTGAASRAPKYWNIVQNFLQAPLAQAPSNWPEAENDSPTLGEDKNMFLDLSLFLARRRAYALPLI